jgi:hypothetical protein
MRFKAQRNIKKQALAAPRMLARRAKRSSEFDLSDATWEAERSPAPEAVFDRLTGPYGSFDEET